MHGMTPVITGSILRPELNSSERRAYVCVYACVCCVCLFRSVVETFNMAPSEFPRQRHGRYPRIIDLWLKQTSMDCCSLWCSERRIKCVEFG